MKIAFDIGGVLSKYPDQFRILINALKPTCEIFVITDMHDRKDILQTLKDNQMDVSDENVYSADYKTWGEFCKARLLYDLKIDMFFDDFGGYLQWDSQLGKSPIRMLVMPDPFLPYWHINWKIKDESDFGRRVTPFNLI